MQNLVPSAACIALCFGLVASCGDGDQAAPTESALDSGTVTNLDASAAPASQTDGGLTHSGPASCDLSGLWIARQNTESLALGQPQYANNWYYYELEQTGDALEVVQHFDCGIEVRGTVRVLLAPATTRALIAHNRQAGRKGTVTSTGDGLCSLSIEPFWSVRGVSEASYAPTPRSTAMTLAEVQSALPLPGSANPELTEDWDGDHEPGITWVVSGIVNGERSTIQRDWTRYFTAPGYTIGAASDFGDVLVRAEFGAEEVVFNAQGLNQLSQPNAAAEHTLTMRFLGRTTSDPRAVAIIGPDDFETCANVRTALPSTQALK